MSYTNVSNMEVQHSEWLRILDFYETELDILKKRLVEVAGKNTHQESSKGAEHFQNQFLVQQNNIDELKHVINQHAHKTFQDVTQHAGKVDSALLADHKNIEADVKQLEKIINELRLEFNVYLAKWM